MSEKFGQAPRAAFESLELRRYFSEINILDFGARPNDGKDDAPAIRKALQASRPGDTLVFSGGTFDIDDEMDWLDKRTYRGIDGATLRGEGHEGHLVSLTGNDITIRGLTFDGGGIFIEKPGNGKNSGITLDNNRFLIDTNRRHGSAITFTSGLQDSKITNNYFTGYNADFAIYGYNYDGLTIANNEIVNMNAGMHIDAFGNSGDLLVEQNFISGTKGMGMEFQGTAKNLVFQDNWYENPSFTSIPGSSGGSTMAYSLILDKSSNITIRRNAAIMPIKGTTGSDYTRIAFEVGGDNALIEDNYSYGGNHVLAMNDGVGSASVTVRNNKFVKFAQGIGASFGSASRILKHSDNGADVDLSWDLDRGKPGRNKRLDLNGVISGTDTDKPPVEPAPALGIEDFKYLSDMEWTDARNSWGPIERDRYNGGRNERDGGRMSIGSKRYLKGIGVAGESTMSFKLNGQYSRFFTDIGIDEHSGSEGSVTFEVWLDGKKVYDSGVMTGDTARKGLNIKVDGVKRLTLVTTNAGDTDKSDHANWAGARLLPKG